MKPTNNHHDPSSPAAPSRAYPSQNEQRASSADRDYYLDILGKAYASQQLDDDELSQRQDAVLKAKTRGELPPLVADLNFAAFKPDRPPTPPTPPTPPARRHTKVGAIVVVAALLAILIIVVISVRGTRQGAAISQVLPGQPKYDQTLTYDDIDRLPPTVQLGGKSTLVDLSSLQVTHDVSFSLDIDWVNLGIALPPDANVVLSYSLGGESTVAFQGGSDVRAEDDIVGVDGTCEWHRNSGAPVLTLNGLITMQGVGMVACRCADMGRGLPMMEIVTSSIRKTSICQTLPFLRLIWLASPVSTSSVW